MPLPLIIPAATALASWVSTITFIGECALGGSAAFGGYRITSYVYNGYRDGIDPMEKRDHQLQREIEAIGMQRMQNLDETVHGIQQIKHRLEHEMDEQQFDLEEIIHGLDGDRTEIKQKTVQSAQLHAELMENAVAQEKLIDALQESIKEKADVIEQAHQQLAISNAMVQETSKELIEAKKRIASFEAQQVNIRQKLKQLEDRITVISSESLQKDRLIDKISDENQITRLQMTSYSAELQWYKKEIEELSHVKKVLSDELIASNSLIGTLTEQLGDGSGNSLSCSSSPSFFK